MIPLCTLRYFYGGCSSSNTFIMYPVGLYGVMCGPVRVPHSPVWSRMVPYGPVWSRMVPYGPVGVP